MDDIARDIYQEIVDRAYEYDAYNLDVVIMEIIRRVNFIAAEERVNDPMDQIIDNLEQNWNINR